MNTPTFPDKICPDCGKPVSTHAMFNPPRCPVVRLSMEAYRKLECDAMLSALKLKDMRAVQAILLVSPPDERKS